MENQCPMALMSAEQSEINKTKILNINIGIKR
jgi:hypothetical protein